jgi:hypothetical protein
MFNPYLFESDVAWHHDKIRRDFAASQLPVSLRGVREVIGHTFIRAGTIIQGKAREACVECAETGRALTSARSVSLYH